MKAIGGYFELTLPKYCPHWLDSAGKFNSARSAFSFLVEQLGVKNVWLPYYLCDTVSKALLHLDININYYSLTEDFRIINDVCLGEESLLLYVNYFGVCTQQANDIINRYGATNVVIDNSQAFFNKPLNTIATIYSPRKFFGLPDGGLLYSNKCLAPPPKERDNSSKSRMEHLISRLTDTPETSYQKYIDAENAISSLHVQRMSHLTERLLYSIDYETVKLTRYNNASYLHQHLAKYNQLNVNIDKDVAPLCYPFLPITQTVSRAELIRNKIFLPSYWPEVLGVVDKNSFEWELVTNGLFLPCDQRYSEDDMDRLIQLLKINK